MGLGNAVVDSKRKGSQRALWVVQVKYKMGGVSEGWETN